MEIVLDAVETEHKAIDRPRLEMLGRRAIYARRAGGQLPARNDFGQRRCLRLQLKLKHEKPPSRRTLPRLLRPVQSKAVMDPSSTQPLHDVLTAAAEP
jgi:hypothetical protein